MTTKNQDVLGVKGPWQLGFRRFGRTGSNGCQKSIQGGGPDADRIRLLDDVPGETVFRVDGSIEVGCHRRNYLLGESPGDLQDLLLLGLQPNTKHVRLPSYPLFR